MRAINKIIIHCTATPEGRPHGVADIDLWHKQRGWDGIGYHYLIGINGELWQGRNIEKAGIHTVGQNANSIGICYVGGCDKYMKPKDTRNPAQKATLLALVKDLLLKYPQATVHGHNEFANKACPCFNVKTEL